MPELILHLTDPYDNHIYAGPVDDSEVEGFEVPAGWELRTHLLVEPGDLTDATEQQLVAIAKGQPLEDEES